jgi:hypothetical protein
VRRFIRSCRIARPILVILFTQHGVPLDDFRHGRSLRRNVSGFPPDALSADGQQNRKLLGVSYRSGT